MQPTRPFSSLLETKQLSICIFTKMPAISTMTNIPGPYQGPAREKSVLSEVKPTVGTLLNILQFLQILVSFTG